MGAGTGAYFRCLTAFFFAGKTALFKLLQAAVRGQTPLVDGRVAVIVEKMVDGRRRLYAFYHDKNQRQPGFFEIDPETEQVQARQFSEAKQLEVIPKYYKPDRIDQIIQSKVELHKLIEKYFGVPSDQCIQRFNDIFAVSRFLEQQAEPLLELAVHDGGYQLFMNTRWGRGKKRMRDIFTLSHSMRKTAMMCMIIIMSDFGPCIIDAPETDFDNTDINNFLVPVIKLAKDSQQIILFTNNPIFSVNADPDNYILLNSSGTKLKSINQGLAIDDKELRSTLLEILEGGVKSFQDRADRYAF